VLDREKANLGSRNFAAQFLQGPLPADDDIIKREWLPSYKSLPPVKHNTRIVQSWDLAFREGQENGYSVCLTAAPSGSPRAAALTRRI
jgi:phage terminase large subunit-like protein